MSRYDDKSGLRKSTVLWRATRKIGSGYQPRRACDSGDTSRSKSRLLPEKNNFIHSSEDLINIVDVSDQNVI